MFKFLIINLLLVFFTTQIQAQIYWASEVVEYSDIQLLTENLRQMIGEPNVMPHGKVSTEAFSANFAYENTEDLANEKPKIIKVRFDSVKHIEKIFVVENFGISIKKVHLFDEHNNYTETYTLNDNFDMNLDMNNKISYISLYKPTAYKVKFLEMEVYPPLYGDEVSQIDAIGVQEGILESGQNSTNDSNIDDNYTLSGYVINEDTDKPLNEVEVKITDLQSGTTQQVWTNEDGKFRVGLRKSSVYKVEVHKAEFFQTHQKSVFTVSYQLHHSFDLQFTLRKIKMHENYSLSDIRFVPNSDEFRASSTKALEDFVQFLNTNSNLKIQIEAHTDSRGDAEYNLTLSKRRAEKLTDYLIENQIDSPRLEQLGHGEKYLLNHCADGVLCSGREHAKNRRIEFQVIGFLDEKVEKLKGKPAKLKY